MDDKGPLIAWLLAPLVLILGGWLLWFAGAGITSGGEWAAHQTYWTGPWLRRHPRVAHHRVRGA